MELLLHNAGIAPLKHTPTEKLDNLNVLLLRLVHVVIQALINV
jgi:hypothetical protein